MFQEIKTCIAHEKKKSCEVPVDVPSDMCMQIDY